MASKKKASAKRVEQASELARKRVGRPTGRKDRVPHTACRYFARNVKLALKAIGKSENKFSKELQVTQPYLNSLLKCKYQPVLSTAVMISEALGISMDTLLSPQVDVLNEVLAKKVAAKKSSENHKKALAS